MTDLDEKDLFRLTELKNKTELITLAEMREYRTLLRRKARLPLIERTPIPNSNWSEEDVIQWGARLNGFLDVALNNFLIPNLDQTSFNIYLGPIKFEPVFNDQYILPLAVKTRLLQVVLKWTIRRQFGVPRVEVLPSGPSSLTIILTVDLAFNPQTPPTIQTYKLSFADKIEILTKG